jgi:hypothetical protein
VGLGSEPLRRLDVIFDYHGRKICAKPNEGFGLSF